jgi:hypothetical protein
MRLGKPSTIVGKLRSNAGGSLDAWHLSQFFGAAPTLSEGFIQDQPPFDRVVAGKSTDKLKPSTKEEKIMKIGKGRKMNQN